MSCVSTPTATQFSTFTTSAVSTSFSEQVTTLPDTTSTTLITSCLSSASASSGGVGDCASSTVITSTTIIDGGVSTTTIPVVVTNVITSSVPTNTLFAPCTDTTNTPTPTDSTTDFTQSSTTTLVTPTTTFTSSQASTLSDGSVTQIVVTVTSALDPTNSVITTDVPLATTQANDNGGSSSALGAIIGGTLGGFVGLLAIIGAVWYFRRRRINFDEIFEKDYDEYIGKPQTPKRGRMLDLEDEPFHPVEANTEPKPYVYGLVGGNSTMSPQSLNAGLVPIPAGRKSPSLQSHTRSSSTAPLMNNAPGSRPASSGDSNHSGGGGAGGGISPSPSFTPSPAVGGGQGRSISPGPGPLGVQIPTGPMFTEPLSPSGADSPTSITGPRGPLRIANALDPDSMPGSPRPGTPATPPVNQRASTAATTGMSNVAAGPSSSPFSGGAAAGGGVTSPSPLNPSGLGPPPAAYAYLAEKQRLQRNDTVSSKSVYSQPSREPTPPPGRALDFQQPPPAYWG